MPPTASTEPAGAAVTSTPQPEIVEITEVNSIRCFNATPTECFLANQLESEDQYRLSNCGSVLLKGGPLGDQHVVTMFDLCSTDKWVSQGTLKRIQFKHLRPFNGLVKTMNGIKKMKLPRSRFVSNWTPHGSKLSA